MTEEDADKDPFEQLDDAVGDRDGDPFESLDPQQPENDADPMAEPGPAGDPDESPADSWKRTESAPSNAPTSPDAAPSDPASPPEAGASEEVPLDGSTEERGSDDPEFREPDSSEMTFDVGRRESPGPGEGGPLSDVGGREGDPFQNVERAFEQVEVDQLDPDVVWQELTSAESRGSVGDAQKRTYAEVSKHSYCEQCEHFSPPPEIACTHEGTEIVEFLDMETVRVVDCPVVTERERLDDDG